MEPEMRPFDEYLWRSQAAKCRAHELDCSRAQKTATGMTMA